MKKKRFFRKKDDILILELDLNKRVIVYSSIDKLVNSNLYSFILRSWLAKSFDAIICKW
jgi:hypothetical protein